MDTSLPSDPIRTCAYSGVERPESQMVRVGEHYVAIECKDEAVQYLQQGNDLESRRHMGLKATPVQLGPLLRKSWELSLKHAGLFLAIYFTVCLPAALLENYLTPGIDNMVESSALEGKLSPAFLLMVLLPMAIAVIDTFATGAILASLSSSWSGMRSDYLSAWAATGRQSLALLSATLITMLLFIFGLVLCIIPGIYVLVKLTFCYCFVMDDRIAGVQSVERSFRLTEGRFWLVLGFMLLVSLMTMAPSIALLSALDLFPWVRDSWQLRGVLQAVLFVPVIFLNVFSFVFYKALRETGSPPEIPLGS